MRPITACALVLFSLFASDSSNGGTWPPPFSPSARTVARSIICPAGELRVTGDAPDAAALPLKHTEVHAEISGCVAQVRLTQVFQNPLDHPIEATYVFPLPRPVSVD